jgi:hypothetical protein
LTRTGQILETIHDLDELGDVSELAALLAPA